MSMSPIHESGTPNPEEPHSPWSDYPAAHGVPHHGYYPHHHHQLVPQNSPYFPAVSAAAAVSAMYHQPNYHHHYPHNEVVAPGDYSPGSDASNNDYFYGNSVNTSSNSSSFHHPVSGAGLGAASNNPSSFNYESTESRWAIKWLINLFWAIGDSFWCWPQIVK